ncbi:MAG: MFS transporter, partial [Candidatus Odinarchaeota archaeon]|nr:MFS transporter [Candidatus Odinarchaeota archaeon]
METEETFRTLMKYSFWFTLPSGILSYTLMFYIMKLASPFWVGFLMGLQLILSVLSRLIAGHLSDRFGRRPLLILTSVLSTLSIFLIALSTEFLYLIVGIMINGIVGSLFYVVSYAVISDIHSGSGEKFGIFSMYTSRGVFIGSFLGVFLLVSLSEIMDEFTALRVMFLIYVIPCLISIRYALKIRETISTRSEKFKTRFTLDFWLLMLIILLCGMAYGFYDVMIIPFIEYRFNAPLEVILLLYIPVGIIYMFLPKYAGKIVDKIGFKLSMPLGIFFSAIGSFLTPFSPTLEFLCLVWSMQAIANCFWETSEKTLISKVTNQGYLGLGYALYTVFFRLPQGISRIFSGVIFEWSYQAPFYIATIIFILSSLISVLVANYVEREEGVHPDEPKVFKHTLI